MKNQRILEGVQDSPATPSMRKWGDTFPSLSINQRECLPFPPLSHGSIACLFCNGSFKVDVDNLLLIGPEEVPPVHLERQVIF